MISNVLTKTSSVLVVSLDIRLEIFAFLVADLAQLFNLFLRSARWAVCRCGAFKELHAL